MSIEETASRAPPAETPAAAAVVPGRGVAAETAFYGGYEWSLDPHPRLAAAVERLRGEAERLAGVGCGWQFDEVATNVFLLACGIANGIDEHLRGPALRLPARLRRTRLGQLADRAVELAAARPWSLRRARLRRWRRAWGDGLDEFLRCLLAHREDRPAEPLIDAGRRLAALAPPGALSLRLGVPSPFDRLDLTHRDVLALGEEFVRRCPDRSPPLLLLGLRTSGSYFAPLLRAFFAAQGYRTTALMTIEPKKGPGRSEAKRLQDFARRGYLGVIIDDPPDTGGAVLAGFDAARRAGFSQDRLKILVPTHPASRTWPKSLPEQLVVTLPPERWHKQALLQPEAACDRLAEYFRESAGTHMVACRPAEDLNRQLQSATSSDPRGTRLKRIFEAELETSAGGVETRYVLAKSVGWGWYGYHAFLEASRLSEFVPPLLGMRDGILYSEWLPQPAGGEESEADRAALIAAAGRYAAARALRLKLRTGAAGAIGLARHNNAAVLVEKALSRAYGRFPFDILSRARVARGLRRQSCPYPAAIDGNMARAEWIRGPAGPLKTDYEHHGLGKAALNLVDPAYDLADTILQLVLSPEEEQALIAGYVEASGDAGVGARLFLNKLLAGVWALNQAQQQLAATARSRDEQQGCHQSFMRAWDFLTMHTARHCGSLDSPPQAADWRAPLVALDIDGVIDQRLFGYPATTAAGAAALAMLRNHGFSLAVATARSVAEVRGYCAAYGLSGGIAEHGSYIWDAVHRRERVLIGAEAIGQLDALRARLRQIPGVFLDDRHRYSIRAFTYAGPTGGGIASLLQSLRKSGIGDGAVAPLPDLAMRQLLADLHLDRLAWHRTTIDTTIVAAEADKGSGLLALRDWALGADAETVAVGDSVPDLAMFRVATRSFAPANIVCAREARLAGCRIVRGSHQRGLLEIANRLAHPDGRPCIRCRAATAPSRDRDSVLQALQAADRPWAANLLGAMSDARALRTLLR